MTTTWCESLRRVCRYAAIMSAIAGVAQAAERPSALVVSADGRRAFTAHRDGAITTIDLEAQRVLRTARFGERLTDLAPSFDGRRLWAVDDRKRQLLLLDAEDDRLSVRGRLPLGRGPVSVRALATGGCVVAELWDRRVTIVELAEHGPEPLRTGKIVPLPFNPRALLVLDQRHLLAADAFGGDLAVIDVESGILVAGHVLPGHHIRGLALSPDRSEVWLAQLVFGSRAEVTRDNLHWGNVVSTVVRSLRVAELIRPDGDPLAGGGLDPVSETGRGAADPGSLAVAAGGVACLVSTGGGEIFLGLKHELHAGRQSVGERPVAAAFSTDGGRLYVVDGGTNTLSVIGTADRSVSAVISLGSLPPPTAAERGERLFYRSQLSHEGWLSCHSCHTDGHTSYHRADTQGDGSFGAAKRTPTLLGSADTGPWTWTGSAATLAAQIRQTMKSTMHADRVSDADVADLAAFLGTLEPPPPRETYDAAARPGEKTPPERGRAVFARRGCAECHTPPTYSSAASRDVGLGDERDNRRFNPPSLRGVGQARALYHDGRARSLEEIFQKHPHATTPAVEQREIADLLDFLRSL